MKEKKLPTIILKAFQEIFLEIRKWQFFTLWFIQDTTQCTTLFLDNTQNTEVTLMLREMIWSLPLWMHCQVIWNNHPSSITKNSGTNVQQIIPKSSHILFNPIPYNLSCLEHLGSCKLQVAKQAINLLAWSTRHFREKRTDQMNGIPRNTFSLGDSSQEV